MTAYGYGDQDLEEIMPTSPEKIERELFVGNVPHGTSDLLLLHFVSAAMRRVRMCEAQDNPVVSSRIGNKFAFVELATPELADKALEDISSLKVLRASTSWLPNMAATNWPIGSGFCSP